MFTAQIIQRDDSLRKDWVKSTPPDALTIEEQITDP